MTSRAYKTVTGQKKPPQLDKAAHAMRDAHTFAEWQAHLANRDYCVITTTWGERHDRPLPIYHLRGNTG